MRVIDSLAFTVVILPLMLAGADAAAQGLIEEVVVTAQKREESIQDVGISVTAFSGAQLREIGATSTTDVVAQVPGMRLFTYTPAFTVFSLRGVSQNNFQDNLEAPVGVYMDGAYVASMNAIGAQMFDMERVEVLRGPQGTLFGRNTTGGLLHFLSRGANEREFNGYLQGSVSEYDKYSVEGAAGGGLADNVRARIAGRWETADGYVESVVPGIRDAHGADGFTVRGSLQVDFTDSLTADLRVSYAEDSDVPSGSYTVRFATFDPATGLGVPLDARLTGNHEHASTLEGTFDRDVVSVTSQLTWALDNGIEVVSITGYLDQDKNYLEDAAGGFGFFPYFTVNSFDQLSQEVRLSGSGDRLRWQVGGYYLDMTWDMYQSVAGALILGGTSDAQLMETISKVDSSNWSVFGQMEVDVTDAVTVIGGLRWSDDDKDIDMRRVYQDPLNGIAPVEVFDIGNAGIPGLDSIDYGDVAARAQINWTPVQDTLVYASFNRGIKGGNWSIDPLGAVAVPDLKHDEEVLSAWEVGLKYTFADGRARLNAAAFFYDYDDYQTFSLVNLTPQVANSDAEAHGGEAELMVTPLDGLELMAGVALLDSEVDAVPVPFGGLIKAEFPLAPSFALNFLGRYEWPALGGTMAVQIDGNHNGDHFLEGTNSAVSFEDSYTVVNAHVSYTSPGDRWTATVWVKNVTDTDYRLYNLDLGLLGFIEQVYAPPQWFGGTISYSWQ